MSKAPIGYKFSGCLNNYRDLLRKFRLDELLKRINKESNLILFKKNDKIGFGLNCTKYPTTDAKTYRRYMQEVYVSAWNLIDLAYYAIMFTNDFRGKTVENDELYFLLNAATDYINHHESELIKSEFTDPLTKQLNEKFFLYMFGFAGEQFKVQSLGMVKDNVTRELYILFESSKNIKNQIDVGNIVLVETGIKWEVIMAVLYLLFSYSTYYANVIKIADSLIWDEDFKYDDFLKILNRYTATYQDVKNSKLGRQCLYTKPFIKTCRYEEIISINSFLNYFLYEHCILWIVRDYFKNKKQENFPSYFGYCFEEYFRELLKEYLEPSEYENINKDNTKKADWKIQLGNFRILVEQKSTIINLSIKQQVTDLSKIQEFLSKCIIKALRQLKNTEQEFNAKLHENRTYIKIILLYDDYLVPEILDNVFKLDECDVDNDFHYWMVTITEMERLLHLYKNDRNTFNKIFDDQMKRASENSPLDGRSLGSLMKSQKNEYLKNKKFTKYSKDLYEYFIAHVKK